MRTQTRIQEFFQRGAGGLSVVFFPFSSRRPFPSPFFSDLRSTWTVPISSPPVPSPLFAPVPCGKKYTTAVTPTPWGTGGACLPTSTNCWAEGHREQKNSKQETGQTVLTITIALTKTTNCTFRARRRWIGALLPLQIRYGATAPLRSFCNFLLEFLSEILPTFLSVCVRIEMLPVYTLISLCTVLQLVLLSCE